MEEDETREDDQPRRVVRRVVRRAPVAPPPPHASARSEAPAPVEDDARAPDPDRAPSPDRPAHRARSGRPSLPRMSWPSFARSTTADDPDAPGAGPADEPGDSDTVVAAPPVAPARADEPDADAPDRPGSEHDGRTPAPSDDADVPAGPSARARLGATAARTRDRVLTATAGARRVVADRAASAPLPAVAAVTGLALGVVATLLCWVATLVFAATLGTPAGGGWGFVVLVVVALTTVVAGARALAVAGAPEPGPTSLVGVLLVPVVVLAFFLGASTTGWVFLIVPLLAAATFAVAQPVVARLAGPPGGRP